MMAAPMITHYFLRVITSMAETEQARRHQLQPSKPAVRLIRVGPLAYIHNKYGEKEGDDHTDKRGRKNKQEGGHHLGVVDDIMPPAF